MADIARSRVLVLPLRYLFVRRLKKNEENQLGDFMKKVIALAIIAAGIYAASTLNIKIEVSTNAAQACSDSSCN